MIKDFPYNVATWWNLVTAKKHSPSVSYDSQLSQWSQFEYFKWLFKNRSKLNIYDIVIAHLVGLIICSPYFWLFCHSTIYITFVEFIFILSSLVLMLPAIHSLLNAVWTFALPVSKEVTTTTVHYSLALISVELLKSKLLFERGEVANTLNIYNLFTHCMYSHCL